MTTAIREVGVELLRHGPRHNQLLSPLTPYLAVCGDFPGGVVHVPYEHAAAQNLLDDLRYTVAAAEATDRLGVIRDGAGTALAEMLADVPGLAGVLAGEHAEAGCLTHLRLVLSASELALLPFELAKVPVGAGSVGDDWLALQPDRPVCITRHVRGVSDAAGWPTRPRILFLSGDDVPFAEHLDVFGRVLEPWRRESLVPDPDRPRHWSSEHLTVIERATLDEIRAAVAEQAFTHVHVLAHGAEIDDRRGTRYGVALGDRVVAGSDLALALASPVGGGHELPSVVTLAACDSAAQGSVVRPGGSVAHDLHASGIPLVVASQFPISEAASVPFVETFYAGQLAGEHPLVSITEVRRALATHFPDEHAWASIVVYEALPADFDARLEELCYWQRRRALDVALERVETLATSDADRSAQLAARGRPFDPSFTSPDTDRLDALLGAVDDAAARLPASGAYAAECDGLRAAAAKRTAEAVFWLAQAPDATAERSHELLARCVRDLETSLDRYTAAVERLLSTSDGEPQHKMTIHWIVGQVVLLRSILAIDADDDLAAVARTTARFDLDHPDPVVRGWATVSLIEIAILELATHGPSGDVAEHALRCAADVVRIVGDDAEHVATTHRQMRRFAGWWADPDFVAVLAECGIERRVDWEAEHGVVPTAQEVAAVLIPPRRAPLLAGRRPGRQGRQGRASGAPGGNDPAPGPGTDAGRDTGPEPHLAAAPGRTGTFELEMLPARNGDCLWIGYGDDGADHHVLIDCGAVAAVDVAAARVRSVDAVELFVLTHIDADHISGAIPLFEDADVAARFDDVWFNGWHQLLGFLSVRQGERFTELLDRDDRPFRWNGTERDDDPPPPIGTGEGELPTVELPGGLQLTVLSPTPAGLRKLARHWNAALRELDPDRAMLARRPRPTPPADPSSLDLEAIAASGPTKDTSVPNLSSIALLAEYGGRSVLLTGDAHADVLAASIAGLQRRRGREGERLRLDALKLSHHGSANATTAELLAAIDCTNYLVSTDGSSYYHPDREAIARVIVHGGPDPVLHFNHRTDLVEFWGDADLQASYGYTTVFADTPGDSDEGGGLVVGL